MPAPSETGMIAANGALMRRVAAAAVAMATFLAVLKAGAFLLTNSMAMLASLADSGLDIFASFVNLLAVRQALMPADREHRFGHGKAEPLAGLAQGAFIAGSAAFLTIESVERLIEPRPIEHSVVGLSVMGVSIVATAVLVSVQKIVVARTGSVAIGADRLHYVSDLLTNTGVIVGILLASRFGILYADPVISILVAGVLAHSAWQVFRRSYDQLMDRELPEVLREKIKAIILAHPAVRGIHDLRTREAGMRIFIQVHLELAPELTFLTAHGLGDEVEGVLRAEFPNAEIIIHPDPAGLETVPELAKS
jgi:ferrous-iron efflux pump FieF